MTRKWGRVALFVCCFLLYAFCVGCPLKRITGISCPFCGMTHAHIALLKGNLSAAFSYNRLFFLGLPAVAAITAFLNPQTNKKLRIAAAAMFSLIFAALCVNLVL